MNFYLRVIFISIIISLWEQMIGSYSGVHAQEVNSIDLQEEVTQAVEGEINEVINEELEQFSQPFINFAAIVKEDEEVIAIAGELETSPGELLQEVNVTLDLDVFDQVDPRDENFEANTNLNINNTAVAINFEVKDDDELDAAIENAIANLGDNPQPSDVISLVEIFLSDVREQAQPRVTAAAGKQDSNNNLNSAIITEVELAPGQRFANFNKNDAPMLIGLGVDGDTGALNELRIERDGDIIAPDDDNFNLEATVARAVENANFEESVGDIIFLVKAFGNGRNEVEGQARVSGGSAIADDNSNTVSAIIGEVQFVSGQLLGTIEDNEIQTLVKVTSQINNNIGGDNIIAVDDLKLTYKIAEESAILESAIADKVNTFNFEETSDAISLVNAFVSDNADEISVINEPQPPSIALE
mgnify:CR=1 FL=1